MSSLDLVDWAALSHAYGSAEDVPAQLLALASADSDARQRAYQALYTNVFHQGTRYEASPHAAAAVVDLAADPAVPDRAELLRLLAGLAIGYDSWHLPGPFPIRDHRDQVARQAAMTVEELDRERQRWVESAPTPALRRFRELHTEYMETEEDRDNRRWALASYDAVRRGVPVYCAALGDPRPEVRLRAAYLLGWFPEPEERAMALPALVRLAAAEPDPAATATAAIAIGFLGDAGDDADRDAARVLRRRLRSRHPIVRWGAAIGLGRRDPLPGRAAVGELVACARHSGALLELEHEVPYADGDLAGLAVLILAELDPAAAPERLDVLCDLLSRWPPDGAGHPVVLALLKIAFPDGAIASDRPVAELSMDQRRVVRALASAPEIWAFPETEDALLECGLPEQPESLRAYAARIE